MVQREPGNRLFIDWTGLRIFATKVRTIEAVNMAKELEFDTSPKHTYHDAETIGTIKQDFPLGGGGGGGLMH